MSDDPGVFYKLAKSISAEERSDLLERLSARAGEAPDTLIPLESSKSPPQSVEECYQRMGLLKKIILFFRSMFSHREIHDLVEDDMIDSIARSIAQSHPDVFENKTQTLGVGFFSNFDSLRTKLQVFDEPLRAAFTGDRREFVAFLGTALLPIEHDKLMHASDPNEMSTDDKRDEFELKKRVQMSTRDALANINKEAKTHMYAMYRALFFLHELVSLPIFRTGINETGQAAGIAAARHRKNISDLCDVVASLRVRPSKTAIEALLLYESRHVSEPDGDFELKFKEDVSKSNAAIQELLSFCSKVPLLDIMKVLNRNPAYSPDALGGGEDWYNYYRQYWEDHADQNLEQFLYGKRLSEFRLKADELVGNSDTGLLRKYHNHAENAAYRVKYAETARFLLLVAEKLFEQKLSEIFKTFLVNGEFYKNQNREEYIEAFNGMSDLSGKLRAMDSMLDADAEVGRALSRIEGEPLPNAGQEKRISELMSRVDTGMEDVFRVSIDDLESMTNVAKGVLFGQSGGAYDTLVNLQLIGGTENKALLSQLESALNELETAKHLTHQIYDLEKSVNRLR